MASPPVGPVLFLSVNRVAGDGLDDFLTHDLAHAGHECCFLDRCREQQAELHAAACGAHGLANRQQLVAKDHLEVPL